MRTVLFTHPSAELYGADRTLLQLVAATAARPDRRAVVALPRRGVLAEHLEAAGALVEIGELGAALRGDLRPARAGHLLRQSRAGARFVRGLVERHDAALVHTNTAVLVGAALGAHRSPARHLWHLHEILERPAWAVRAARALVSRWSDLAVANSAATAAAMIDTARHAFEVVHNGVDAARFAGPFPPPAAVRAQYGLPPEGHLVVLPGRVNGWKGQVLLVEAVARRRRAFEGRTRFLLVGDPPPAQDHHGDALRRRVAELGVGDLVRLAPFTEDLPALLAAADLCVVPSTRPEPFGLVAIEAMAVGTPVVAAGHGGVVEAVVDGVTGALVPPRDAEALAERVRALLDAPRLRARMGLAARRRVAERFTAAHHTTRLLALHDRLLGAGPSWAAPREAA